MRPTTAARWLRPFQIDVRALAAMRIALGLATLYEVWTRIDLIPVYYTDAGVTPRSVVFSGALKYQSFFSLGGSYGFALTLLLIHAALALLLTIGYQTRIVTVLLAASLWSLINRNPTLSHGGNNLEVWLLIWSILLPIGAAWSVDARLGGARIASRRYASIATVAILLQVVYVYWNALAIKNNADWRSDFTAVYYFLNSHLATPLGYAIGQSPLLCQLLTIATLGLELFGAVFALITFSMPRTRTAIALIFIGFHLGLVASMYVGSFSLICIAAWFLYIPTPTWDAIARWRPQRIGRIPAWPGSRLAQAGVAALIVYITIVNLVGFLPDSVRMKTGPLARLPRIKQSWGVMDVPWRYFQTLMVEVEQADGTVRTVAPNDAADGSFAKTVPLTHVPAEYWKWPLWWNERCCLVEYRSTLLLGALKKQPQWISAYIDFHRRKWNEFHPDASQQAKSVKAYVVVYATKPPTGTQNLAARDGRQLLYEWPGRGK